MGWVVCQRTCFLTSQSSWTARTAAVYLFFITSTTSEWLKRLPVAVQSQLHVCADEKTGNDAVTLPLELLDECISELRAMCMSWGEPGHFFLSEPSENVILHCRSTVGPQLKDTQLTQRLPVAMATRLKAHQLQGISKILSFSGRALLADDMGVGKTLQALGAISLLNAFPLLIICPSAVKVMWADEIEKYLFAQVTFADIHLIHGSNTALSATHQPKVVIVSYHMAAALSSMLLSRTWDCVVCDESHLLRTNTSGKDAQYTTAAVLLCKRARHCLLLSGTPALSNPFDMFNQIDAVSPGMLGSSRWDFALRYTHMSFTPYVNIGHCTRPLELMSFLRSTCLIRRTKTEVLDLPSKTRIIVRVVDQEAPSERSSTSFQSRYAQQWELKRRGIMDAVVYFIEKYSQVVLFAHHLSLLNEIGQLLRRRGISFIRIDGSVVAAARHELVASFDRKDVRVALMGITACAVGISLASAHCAVFCELPPDAAWLAQAEDRLHRLGQASEVTVYYLLGVHSPFDADHFAHLVRGHRQVHSFVDNQEMTSSLVFQHAVHGQWRESAERRDGTVGNAPVPVSLQQIQHHSKQPLQFAVSGNTGRIHVRREPAFDTPHDCEQFYWNGTLMDARACIRARVLPFWEQLAQFLDNLAMHSSNARRKIEREALWLPCNFTLKRSRAALSGIRVRYTVTPPRCGWGFWWLVRRHFSSTNNQYFAALRLDSHSHSFEAQCLNCGVRPASLVNVSLGCAPLRPGASLLIDSDAAMFCSGACRESFYTRRSSGALRRSVLELDRGVCNHCHVDCERLCYLLASTDNEQSRLQMVELHHPHMMQFPSLVRKLVQHPIPGNCWHADHVVPVSHGGGVAALDNVQTLCVACHALKTCEDNRRLTQLVLPPEAAEALPLTTSRAAYTHFTHLSGCPSRVTQHQE